MKHSGIGKGKNRILRRGVALLLCVSMILGMVYLNGRKDSVEGAPESEPVVDTTFLDNSVYHFDDPDNVQEFTVYEPVGAAKLTLGLPAIDTGDTGSFYAWYQETDPPVKTSDSTYDDGAQVTGLGPSGVTTAVLYKVVKYSPAVEADPGQGIEAKDEVPVEITQLSKVSRVTASVETDVYTKDDTTRVISLVQDPSDPSLQEDKPDTDLFYATAQYIAVMVDGEDPDLSGEDYKTSWGTKAAADEILNKEGNAFDGTYKVGKRIMVGKDHATVDSAVYDSVTRDFYFDITGAEIAVGTTKGTVQENTLTITGVKPTADVVLTFTMSDAATGLSITAATTGEDAKSYSAADAKTITIPGNAAYNENKQRVYTVTIHQDGKQDVVYTADITYLNSTPVISDVKVYGKQTTDSVTELAKKSGTYYFSAEYPTVRVEAKALPQMEGVAVSKVALLDSGNNEVATAVPDADGMVQLDVDLTEGGETYQLWAYTDADGSAKYADSIVTFYDKNAPGITSVTSEQGGNAITISGNTLEGLLFAEDSLIFTVKGADNTGESGLEDAEAVSFLISGAETPIAGVKDGEAWKITIPADVDRAGKQITGTLTFQDIAGNTSTADYTFSYSNGVVTISHVILPNPNSENATNMMVGGSRKDKLLITYTMQSDVDLQTLRITYGQKKNNSGSVDESSIDTTIAKADFTLTNDPAVDGYYVYTYETTIDADVTERLNDLSAVATNIYGKTGTDTISIIKVDLTDPYWKDNYPIDTNWYRTLLLNITYGDTSESGLEAGVNGKSLEELTNAVIKSGPTDNGDGTWSATIQVNSSKDQSGTKVSFQIRDLAGNISAVFDQTYYVDNEQAKITALRVNNLRHTQVNDITGSVNWEDPTISYRVSDNICVETVRLVIKRNGTVLYDEKKTVDALDASLDSIEMSKLIGAAPEDGTYEVRLEVRDKVNKVVSDAGLITDQTEAATIVTAKFTRDTTAPAVGVELQSKYRTIRKDKRSYVNTPLSLSYDYNYYIGSEEVKTYVYVARDTASATITVDSTIAGTKSTQTYSMNQLTWSNITRNGKNVKRAELKVDKEGTYTIKVQGKDSLGNDSEKDKLPVLSFIIDTTAPVLHLSLNGADTPSGDQGYFGAEVEAGFRVEEKYKDAEENSLLVIKTLNGKTDKDSEKIKPVEEGNRSYGEDAKYQLVYEAVDRAGNRSSKTISFTVDTVQPVADILIRNQANTPRFEAYHNTYNNPVSGKTYDYGSYFNHGVAMDLKVSDPYVNEITVKHERNGKLVTTLTKDNFDGLEGQYAVTTEGTHKISITAKDKAGNVSKTQWVTFVIDMTAPVIKLMVDGNETTAEHAGYFGYAVDAGFTVTEAYKDGKLNKLTVDKTPNGGGEKDEEVITPAAETTRSYGDNADYVLKYEVSDRAGNKATKQIEFVVDKERPVVDILMRDPENTPRFEAFHNDYNNPLSGRSYSYGSYFNHAVSMDFRVSDHFIKGISVTDECNGSKKTVLTGENFDASGVGRYSVNTEGTHTIELTARDMAGNISVKQSVSFVIDTTAPELWLEINGEDAKGEDAGFFSKAVKAGFRVRDLYPDDDEYQLVVTKKLNGADSATSETIRPVGAAARIYGENAQYVLNYEVYDRAGNKATQKVGFVVDTEKPVTDIQILEPDNAAKFATYHSSYLNPLSGRKYNYANYYNHAVNMGLMVTDHFVDSITVTDTLDGQTRTVLTGERFSADGTARYSVSSEGEHKIVITAKDHSGNVASEQSVTFTIDTTAPVVSTVLNGTTFSEGTETRYLAENAVVGVTVTDRNKDEADVTRNLTVNSPRSGSSSTVTKISEGNDSYGDEADYTVTYSALDRAGNPSANRTVTFRIDKTQPVLGISSDAVDGTSKTEVKVEFTLQEAFYSDMASSVIQIYRKLDGQREQAFKTIDFRPTGQTTTVSETFAEDGEYRIEFEATDRTGNPAKTAYSFILDKTAPVLELKGVNNYDKTSEDVEFGMMVTENFYLTSQVKLDGSVTDIDQKTNPVEFSDFDVNSGREVSFTQVFSDDGIYDIKVNSQDKVGNETKEKLFFTIDKTPPEIGDISRYDGVRLKEFHWDIDEKELVKDLTVCDVTIYLDGTVYDGMSTLSDGVHVLKVTAVDELGHTSSKEVSFILDQIAPNVIISGIENGQQIEQPANVTVSLQIDDDILDSVKLNGVEQTIVNNSASFAVDKEGDYMLEVKAHDSAGNEKVVDWTFGYGTDMNWWWIALIAGGVILILVVILLIVRQKSWSKKK